MLAALNHPNIAAIYGVEDAGDVRALVMELVEGETLAEQIARGPVPMTEALAIARQIAVALEAAHEQGIVHRDLKPANIKLREDGTVKVLDFGLAKLADPVGASAGASSISLSPTITSPALMTNAGMLLGTAAYMSPEQAKGRAADKRSDMWAFGCVLFEMLSGKRAFDGDDVSETLAGVLRGDPEWAALPAETPPAIRALLRRCLEKDRRTRVADSAAVLFALEEHSTLVADAPPPDDAAFQHKLNAAVEYARRTVEQRGRRRLLASLAAAILAVATAIAGTWWTMRADPARVSRLALPLSREAVPSVAGIGSDIAITPDGSRIVFYTGGAGQATSSFAVRSLDADAATPLRVPQAGGAFLSPDGGWIGYYDLREGAIKKVPIAGGPAVPIASGLPGMRGASWTPDGGIIFGTPVDGLWRVPPNGGKATPLTVVDKTSGNQTNHGWPHVLPGGRAALFAIVTAGESNPRIAVVDLATKQYREIIAAGTFPRYSPTGHVLYAAGGTLFAAGFDLETMTVTSRTPEPIVDGVVTKDSGAAAFDISANGTLVYMRGGSVSSRRSVAWVDMQGRQHPVPKIAPGEHRSLSVGPGGRQIALQSGAPGDGNLWIYDVARATRNTLTSGAGDDRNPTWTPDGRRIVFSSNRDGQLGIYAINADGTGSIDKLATISMVAELFPHSWSDAKTLIVSTAGTGTSGDVLAVSIADGKVTPLLATPVVETQPAMSPNGQWLAYMAVRERRPDVYVERYPQLTDRRTLSDQAAVMPLWSADGREVYYFEPGPQQMMSVSLSGSLFGAPKPLFKVPLFQQRAWRTFDLMPDGRFIMILRNVDGEEVTPVPMVIQNFSEELKRRVPVK